MVAGRSVLSRARGDRPAGRARHQRSRRGAARGRDDRRGRRAVVESAAIAHGHAHEHHGPPLANQSSRVEAQPLGVYLFIISETMLFGSFFTAYFFIRVVGNEPWPPHPFHFPVNVALMNTFILVFSSVVVHWSLISIKRGNRAGLQAGLAITFLMGLTF